MNKRFHLLLLIMGNLLTLGAIFIYAVQSQVQVVFSTYGTRDGIIKYAVNHYFLFMGRCRTPPLSASHSNNF